MGMFHDGDLQSGISRAISEQKLVAVLVRQDDDYWSQIWEEHWLANQAGSSNGEDTTLGDVVGHRAVLLRIDFGSKGAGFLGAFCAIVKAPTLVIINNGQVVDKLEGGMGQDEFIRRLLVAVGLDPQENIHESEQVDDSEDPGSQAYADRAAAAPHRTATMTTEELQDPLSPQTTIAEPVPEAILHPAAEIPEPPRQPAPNVQTLLQERSQRLEADRIRREAAEKQERIARAKARREEAEAAQSQPGAGKIDKGKGRATDYNPLDAQEETRTKARADWIQQQAKRKEEAKRERERILLQIESDKQERRNKEKLRKETNIEAEPLSDARAAAVRRSAGGSGSGNCSLLIRLFDGSSIKGRFAPDTTLATGVRMWISETSPTGGADIPYNFRQILAPKPSRQIEVTEESQSLAELGLLPNATLVLVPVAGYTDAYTQKGVLSSGYLGSAYNLISWGVSLPFSALNYLRGGGLGVNSSDAGSSGLYMGGTADEQEPSNVAGSRMAGADTGTHEAGSAGRASGGSARMKTLADKRAEEEKDKKTEFYNGNSLGFEPRKDDDGRSNPNS